MSLATLHSRAQRGIQAPQVTIEVHLANGLPALSIVGLPELAVRESKDRVRGALLNAGFEFPARRITINLAPADLPKEGGRFDLPIALGILAASGQIPQQPLERYEFLGELSLAGNLRPVRGLLPAALACRDAGRGLVLPGACTREAGLVSDLPLFPADHLLAVCELLHAENPCAAQPTTDANPRPTHPDLADVRGQLHARRALEIAAAGGHSLLMMGPPGSGKTLLASRLPGLLPEMSETEALESAAIRSVSAQGFSPEQWRQRPFRAPHHTASAVALVGGGSHPQPGEISLAHNGVLFLDELPEFERRVLEVLREPLESGHVVISRAARQERYPARFQLIAAMNPCPCGHLGDSGGHACRCSGEQVARYRGRLSGPLLDRIDMLIEVPRLPPGELHSTPSQPAEPSATVQARVAACRARQLARHGRPNSQLEGEALMDACRLTSDGEQLLERALTQLKLSARAYHRILRLARTIADLQTHDRVEPHHLSEAIGYRRLDARG